MPRPKNWWRDLPLLAKGALVVSIPILALITSVTIILIEEGQDLEATQAVNRTMRVQTTANEALSLLLEAESGVRAYVATGKTEFLEEYPTIRRRFARTFDDLSSLVRDERAKALLGEVKRLADERLAMLETLREHEARDDLTPEEELEAIRRGKIVMEEVQGAMNDFLARQEYLLEVRGGKLEAQHEQTHRILAGSVVLGILGGLLALGMFSIGVARRIKEVGANAWLVGQGSRTERNDPRPR